MNEVASIKSAAARVVSPLAKAVAQGRVEAYGRKLMRYLSGGGLAAFTRTMEDERVETKQDKFLFGAAIVGVAWLLFWIF